MGNGERQGEDEQEEGGEETEGQEAEVDYQFVEEGSQDGGCYEGVAGLGQPAEESACQGCGSCAEDLEHRPGAMTSPHEEVGEVEGSHARGQSILIAEEKGYDYGHGDYGLDTGDALEGDPAQQAKTGQGGQLQERGHGEALTELLDLQDEL